jgi:MOSC domain-containing protein YiiM
MAQLLAIWVKRVHGGLMDARTTAELVTGKGLQGDATQGGRRQVTIMSFERWQALTSRLPGPPEPELRRANLLLEGVELDDSRGRVLRIGDARVRIFGETRPCRQMDEACPGLQEALSPPWGGGVFGEVIAGGPIRVGSSVSWQTDAEADATDRRTPSAATP